MVHARATSAIHKTSIPVTTHDQHKNLLSPFGHGDIPRWPDAALDQSITPRLSSVLLHCEREDLETQPMTKPAFEDSPPLTDQVNAYDETHLSTYLRLLDAADEGADWREVVRIVFGLDPTVDPDRARRIHDTHLARARWMTETGYRHLLEARMQ